MHNAQTLPAKQRVGYLTIDDSPTRHTDDLTDWLVAQGIPAVLFCIGSTYKDLHLEGEGMVQRPEPILRAIEKGFHIGNHSWSHRRACELSYQTIVDEIEKTEQLIDGLYRQAGRARPAKLLRFPYLDRGSGGWIVDYTKLGPHKDYVTHMFGTGLNMTLDAPPPEWVEKKHRLQDYLTREGFRADVYPGMSFDWYAKTEMATARDHLMTFSTSDWMLNPDFARYNSDWAYHSVDDITTAMDADPGLNDCSSAHIIIAHDHTNLLNVTTQLIVHLVKSGMTFQEIQM